MRSKPNPNPIRSQEKLKETLVLYIQSLSARSKFYDLLRGLAWYALNTDFEKIPRACLADFADCSIKTVSRFNKIIVELGVADIIEEYHSANAYYIAHLEVLQQILSMNTNTVPLNYISDKEVIETSEIISYVETYAREQDQLLNSKKSELQEISEVRDSTYLPYDFFMTNKDKLREEKSRIGIIAKQNKISYAKAKEYYEDKLGYKQPPLFRPAPPTIAYENEFYGSSRAEWDHMIKKQAWTVNKQPYTHQINEQERLEMQRMEAKILKMRETVQREEEESRRLKTDMEYAAKVQAEKEAKQRLQEENRNRFADLANMFTLGGFKKAMPTSNQT